MWAAIGFDSINRPVPSSMAVIPISMMFAITNIVFSKLNKPCIDVRSRLNDVTRLVFRSIVFTRYFLCLIGPANFYWLDIRERREDIGEIKEERSLIVIDYSRIRWENWIRIRPEGINAGSGHALGLEGDFHLILQPSEGNCWALTGFPLTVALIASLKSLPWGSTPVES